MSSILSPHVAGESLGKCLKGNCHVNSSDIVRSLTILHNEQYITEFCICVSQDITCSLQKAAQYCPVSTCYNNCYIWYRPSLKSLALCRGYITVTSRKIHCGSSSISIGHYYNLLRDTYKLKISVSKIVDSWDDSNCKSDILYYWHKINHFK